MRSDLVFGALKNLDNRYVLCQLASKATRKFHRPNTRVQETMNDVLTRFSKANQLENMTPDAQRYSEPQRRAA
jgi:hypothetical protein